MPSTIMPHGGLRAARHLGILGRFSRQALPLLAVGLLASHLTAADEDPRPQRPTRFSGQFQRRMLEEFDTDGNGQLDDAERTEMRAAMARRQQRRPGIDREEFMKRFDRDGNGRLSDEERQAAMKARGGDSTGKRASRPMLTPAERAEMMKRFDKDGDGKLDDSERAALRQAVVRRQGTTTSRPNTARPNIPSPESAARRNPDVIRRFDKDGDGRLDPAERAAARAAFEARSGARGRSAVRDAVASTPATKPDTGRVSKRGLLEKFDANRDGKLTGDERAAARKAFEDHTGEKAPN